MVSVADGYLWLCRIPAAMAAAPYHGELCVQLLRGNGDFQTSRETILKSIPMSKNKIILNIEQLIGRVEIVVSPAGEDIDLRSLREKLKTRLAECCLEALDNFWQHPLQSPARSVRSRSRRGLCEHSGLRRYKYRRAGKPAGRIRAAHR